MIQITILDAPVEIAMIKYLDIPETIIYLN
jgi:hypothetical protein